MYHPTHTPHQAARTEQHAKPIITNLDVLMCFKHEHDPAGHVFERGRDGGPAVVLL